MAGGKETPRQKMIGMMYLVLTALLALNVSKEILDAFVAIELNIQKGAETQKLRGDVAKSDLEASKSDVTKDAAGQERLAKIERFIGYIDKIDKETAKVIKTIDDIKINLLKESGEDVKTKSKDGRPQDDIIINKFYSTEEPLQPASLNLDAVQRKDNFDDPMRVMFGPGNGISEKLNPGTDGEKLWKAYNTFRKECVQLAGTYVDNGKSYKVKLKKEVNNYKDLVDLDKQLKKLINTNSAGCNKEDIDQLIAIYEELTKNEFDVKKIDGKKEKEKIHWIGRTFDHSPLVGAIASLSSMQMEVLSARAKAVNLLKSKISTGQYSFNKIIGLAYPESAVLNPGEQFTVQVMMAAYDSDKQPDLKGFQGSISSIKDGVATLSMRAPNTGVMNISGEVGIADKSGTMKWMPYKTKVTVGGQPAGALEMPEYNVLYAGYNNIIVPVASGVISTSLSAGSPTTWKGRKAFIVRTSSKSGTTNISFSGKDSKGNTINFGTTTFINKPFPKADITTKTVSKIAGGAVVADLPQDALVKASFSVISIEVANGEEANVFSGNRIPKTALTKFRIGKSVGITAIVKNNLTGDVFERTAVLKIK
jgi:hypothetical protein